MSGLSKLIERVEALTGPDREVDAEICVALRHVPPPRYDYVNPPRYEADEGSITAWVIDSEGRERRVEKHRPEPVTASLDAAVALVERVLPDHMWEIGKYTVADGFPAGVFARVDTYCGGDGPRFEFGAQGPMPAIALVLALLRAHAAQGEAQG